MNTTNLSYSPSRLLAKLSSDADFSEERVRTAKRAQYAGRAALIGIACSGGIAILEAIISIWTDLPVRQVLERVIPQALLAPIAVASISGILIAMVGATLYDHYVARRDACQPLAGTPLCLAAGRLTQDFAVARKLRDKSLKQGRQLYVADLHAMQEATAGQEPEGDESRWRAACASLHNEG